MTQFNETQEQFASALLSVNRTLERLFTSGDVSLFSDLNGEIKELCRLQESGDPLLAELAPEAAIVRRNFNMIVSVLRTTENGEIDRGAQTAINKFLHNIDEATVNIAAALGLVEP